MGQTLAVPPFLCPPDEMVHLLETREAEEPLVILPKEEEESIRIRNRISKRREAQHRAVQSCIGYHRALKSCAGLRRAENRAAHGRKRSSEGRRRKYKD
jgi:hypothetical protein